ncbi:MAG: hypothetical protein KDD82_19295 [Planctomycetes bacterium]|nr:hypothetical protein [Planctomycetota bacterium]
MAHPLAHLDAAPDRVAIAGVLEAIAAKKLAELKFGMWGSARQGELEVLAAAADGPRWVVHFLFDVLCSHNAQSGSDWETHHVFVGRGVFSGGALSAEAVLEEERIPIYEQAGSTDHYDPRVAVHSVRAEALARLGSIAD